MRDQVATDLKHASASNQVTSGTPPYTAANSAGLGSAPTKGVIRL